jgi:hypothetical protein
MPLDAPVTSAARSGTAESKQSYDPCVPFAIVVLLALLLGAAAIVFENGGEEKPTEPLRPAGVERIVAAVERERGLKFERVPRPAVVTPEQARREGVELLDEDYPPARRRADEEMLALLGLVPDGTDLKEAYESTLTDLVAGYYDPRKNRLRIVSGAQTANRVLYEMVLAHELTHVLEDQAYEFDLDVLAGGGDRALALTALIEGTATALMYRYVEERFEADELLAGVAASAFQSTGDLPPFLTAQVVFPYTAGEVFVTRLLRVGGGGWRLVDAALRFRPPQSTEQVLHPDKYLRLEAPQRVPLGGPVRALGAGWRPLARSTFGEWQTQKLLARAGGTGSARAAAGWGGDAYALLGRGDDRALVMRWVWDTPRDEAEFASALRSLVANGLPQTSRAAVGRAGGAVTLAIAPDVALARRVARAD